MEEVRLSTQTLSNNKHSCKSVLTKFDKKIELACATCHLIFEQEIFDTLPEKDPEEDDMLDLAMELTDTSRLGCQICVREDMAGMKVRIPDDGY